MTDRLFNIAAFAAVTLQLAVGIVFFGSLTLMILLGFGVLPAPY